MENKKYYYSFPSLQNFRNIFSRSPSLTFFHPFFSVTPTELFRYSKHAFNPLITSKLLDYNPLFHDIFNWRPKKFKRASTSFAQNKQINKITFQPFLCVWENWKIRKSVFFCRLIL